MSPIAEFRMWLSIFGCIVFTLYWVQIMKQKKKD